MDIITKTAPALLAAALLGGCAANPPQQATGSSNRSCFLASQVNDFDSVDDDTIYVTVGANRMYELQLFGTCPDIDFKTRIGLRATSGSPWICRGLDAELLVPNPIGPQRCLVRNVRELSPPEVEAARQAR